MEERVVGVEMNVEGERGLSTFPGEFRLLALGNGIRRVYVEASPITPRVHATK